MTADYNKLKRDIKLWNESRFDLFAISELNENRECHGVIRFYHQDSSNNGKYATKCVRVSNMATTEDVISTLAEKFRSDMRMLTRPNYALYEVHVDGEFRKLDRSEHPLLVQLKWIKDDREGRFLLRNEDDASPVTVGRALYEESEDTVKGFKLTRNLTKKEKKNQRKKEKGAQKSREDSEPPPVVISAAKQLYSQVPESTFTRTVSNPEAVMKKRREQKLQKRGAKVLKVYGDTLNKEIPYKSLLLLPGDKTETVIRDALDKYGFGNKNSSDFSLIQIVMPPGSKPEECFEGGWGKENVLGPDECPLVIDQEWQSFQGTMIFQLREKKGVSKSQTKKPEEITEKSQSSSDISESSEPQKKQDLEVKKQNSRNQDHANLPTIIELSRKGIRIHPIHPNVTEIGSNQETSAYENFIQLYPEAGLLESHCVITSMDGIVTITPQDHHSENVVVNSDLIDETTMLSHGSVIRLGKKDLLFCDSGRRFTKQEIIHKLSNRVSSNHQAPRHINKREEAPMSPNGVNQPRQMQSQNNVRKSYTQHQPPMAANVPQKSSSPSTNDLRSQHRLPSYIDSHTNVDRLPISINIAQNAEGAFLSEIFNAHGHSLHFKLSPSYSVYLLLRFFAQQSSSKTAQFIEMVSHQSNDVIEQKYSAVAELAFWMANISEMLNFLRQDQDLTYLSNEAQDSFAKTVQLSFRHLVQCMQRTLFSLMPAFLSQSDEDLPGSGDRVDLKQQQQNTDEPTMYDILRMLSSAMSLLRKCRVNAALTIQLFSQLFHSINMWLFNKLVTSERGRSNLCTRQWGIRIRARLAMIEGWAEKQGLELAADCHLARITQATYLLQAPKHSGDDIAAISGTCFKLNSLQLQALLSHYEPDYNERMIPSSMIEQVVSVAESSADELMRSDGRNVQLLEDPDLQLPFLLPEDGYSCDVVHGVPSGLVEFLQAYVQRGICSYAVEPTSSGSWTTHFNAPSNFENFPAMKVNQPEKLPDQPDIINVQINKKGGGMGLSIVAARGQNGKLGIYIRSVVDGSAADQDGRLQAGDQLLSVDGQSLVGISQERAANLMVKTGQQVELRIAKQGAIYQGLAMILQNFPEPPVTSPPPQHTPNYQQPEPSPQHNATPPMRFPSTSSPSQMEAQGFPPEKSRTQSHSERTDLYQQAPPPQHHHPDRRTPSDPRARFVPDQRSYEEPKSRYNNQMVAPENRMPAKGISSSVTALDNPNYDKVEVLMRRMPRQKSPAEDFRSSQPKKEFSASAVNLTTPGSPKKIHFQEQTPPPKKRLEERRTPPVQKKEIRDQPPEPEHVERLPLVENNKTRSPQKKPNKHKKEAASKKSSTLPRHFKSGAQRANQEQTIQDELNALRDEEINELLQREPKLNSMEKDRLNTLLQERDFQNRIQEERMKLFSDEEFPSEDFSNIPDRPDRERLLKHQDSTNNTINESPDPDSAFVEPKTSDEEEIPDVKNQTDYSPSTQQTKKWKSQEIFQPQDVASRQRRREAEEREEAERRFLEEKLSAGKRSSFRPNYRRAETLGSRSSSTSQPPASQQEKDNIQQIRQRIRGDNHTRAPRPVSDGYALSDNMKRSTNYNSTNQASRSPGYAAKRLSPSREKSSSTSKFEPSTMTFRDRQRLFQGGSASPVQKNRTSKTLLELEKSLKTHM